MTTWRKKIIESMRFSAETPQDIVGVATSPNYECSFTDEERKELDENFGKDSALDREFDDGFGGPEGCYFTVWTTGHVYFPVVYDGAESVGCVSRNPDGQATPHVGSW